MFRVELASRQLASAITYHMLASPHRLCAMLCCLKCAATAARHGDDSSDELERLANLAIGLAFGCLLELGIVGMGGRYALNIYQAQREVEDLSVLVGLLAENEQQVIRRHYFQHLIFVEIAEVMGVTKGRVSQIHGRAVRRLGDVYRNQSMLNLLLDAGE